MQSGSSTTTSLSGVILTVYHSKQQAGQVAIAYRGFDSKGDSRQSFDGELVFAL